MTPAKHYTIEEANALLPYLAPTLVELREGYEEAMKIREAVGRAAVGNGWSGEREEWSETLARVAELLGRLEEWGLHLRDVAMGLIDFPAIVEGEDAFLCWRLGEAEVTFWHSQGEGFSGRRPL